MVNFFWVKKLDHTWKGKKNPILLVVFFPLVVFSKGKNKEQARFWGVQTVLHFRASKNLGP
jgi:hypothetical protein